MKLPKWIRLWRARPRLTMAIAVGIAAAWLVPGDLAVKVSTRGLIGWNTFALLYLAVALRLMAAAGHAQMCRRAMHQEEGRLAILSLVITASIAVLLAVGSQLSAVKDMHGLRRDLHIGLAALTVLTSWFFTQTMFALHYAHDFFVARARGQPEGLEFPGTPDPYYSDFLYFSCVIGTSGQTADVSLTSTAMRRIGLAHCVQAFFFNTTVLALTINIAAGLF